MSFDANAFKNAPWVHRTQDVPVPELASFFASDERPVWRVRNLTAPELARANNATSHLRRGAALAEALEADDTRGIIAATRELIGRGAARDPEIPAAWKCSPPPAWSPRATWTWPWSCASTIARPSTP